MTIPKGAKMKNISMGDVVLTLMSHGFELEGTMPDFTKNQEVEAGNQADLEDGTIEKIKGYLRRLGAGEDLEQVRQDFAREFQSVEASEIMEAEQQLLKEGTPLTEVQRLCDVHSALFHGATQEEKIANAEKAVEESLNKKKQEISQKDYSNKQQKAAALTQIVGHPLYTLKKENQEIQNLLEVYKEKKDVSLLEQFREVAIHYAKKGDLVYPVLKVRYGVTGPSDVMWTVDDEIRDELSALSKISEKEDAWMERFDRVLTRVEEMLYKEENILFPICAVNLSEEEWFGIYQDSKDYATCFSVTPEVWPEAENHQKKVDSFSCNEIVMAGGHMTVEQMAAMLNTIPLEISFVDAENINRFFNEGPKVFKRPAMAIDREVFSCHPPKIEPMVRQIIEDFRNGKRDEVPVWMEKNGRTMLVKYMAVRDKSMKYLGTLEIVQDMEFAKEHFGIK